MTDEEDKTDRVISLADFQKAAADNIEERVNKALESGDPSALMPTVEEVLDLMKNSGLESVVILGQQEDGKFRFGSNMVSYEDTIFLMEAYKKIILDNIVGHSSDD